MECSRLEEITQQACDAAAQGRWDLVERLYEERESELTSVALSDAKRQQIVALDRRVEEHARVARGALGLLLQETATQRQKVEEWRRRISVSLRDAGTVQLRA
ncbi:MAG: hypothetical protein OEY28_11445 [Nitrospira sp.]|nr:hypothetical protein [Nitrospira sp.]